LLSSLGVELSAYPKAWGTCRRLCVGTLHGLIKSHHGPTDRAESEQNCSLGQITNGALAPLTPVSLFPSRLAWENCSTQSVDAWHDYDKAPPLIHAQAGFEVRIERDHAVVRMREHYATIEAAGMVIEPFFRAWELGAALRRGLENLNSNRPQSGHRRVVAGGSRLPRPSGRARQSASFTGVISRTAD
jgi:hypothetical protein